MREIILQLVTAFSCSLGFAIVFKVRVGLLIPASIGATLSWAIYLAGMHFQKGLFVSCLLAAVMATIYAEVQARVWKAPATLFLVPSLIPLIPGSTLYYTMSSIVRGEWEAARDYGGRTIQYALAIAAGISLVWAVCTMMSRIRVSIGNKEFRNESF